MEQIRTRAQLVKIGAEVHGEEVVDAVVDFMAATLVGLVDHSVEGQVGDGVTVDVVGGSGNFDPLACYRCGIRGHLARYCPSTNSQSMGSSITSSSYGTFSKSAQKGPHRGR